MADSTGRASLMPLYPSRSPSPPATRTKAAAATSCRPAASAAQNGALPKLSVSPSGTDGTQPSNGLAPARASASRLRARDR